MRWIMLAKREIRAGRQDATTPVAPGPLPADELAPGGAERLVPCVAARPPAAPALAEEGPGAVELGGPGRAELLSVEPARADSCGVADARGSTRGAGAPRAAEALG
ncbi:MAG: hypothetical protein QOI69_3322, partial [Pseudonocardiales bacterium]|nr:hypothetical protein [Pseudonocardiales bacterium]